MSFIIKISHELDYFRKNKNDIIYLAVKKPQYVWVGRTIALYKKENNLSGIYAIGTIMGQPLKVSEIPKEDQALIYNRNQLQVPVKLTRHTVEILLEQKYLNHLPSLNQGKKVRTFNFDKIYWAGGLSNDLEFFLNKNWWYFSYLAHPTENHFKYWIHTLREKRFSRWEFKQYKSILKNKNQCSVCGMTGNTYKEFYHDFWELHETTKIDFDEEYKQIDKSNFVIVCPNCHKLEHEKIKAGK